MDAPRSSTIKAYIATHALQGRTPRCAQPGHAFV